LIRWEAVENNAPALPPCNEWVTRQQVTFKQSPYWRGEPYTNFAKEIMYITATPVKRILYLLKPGIFNSAKYFTISFRKKCQNLFKIDRTIAASNKQ